MNDLDTLRPEVATALGFIERNLKYGDGTACEGDVEIIRAELLRLAKENADLLSTIELDEQVWVQRDETMHRWIERARNAEAELAALKARIADGWPCGVSNDACPGNFDAAIYCLPSRFRGKRVRLVAEE